MTSPKSDPRPTPLGTTPEPPSPSPCFARRDSKASWVNATKRKARKALEE